MSCCNIQVSFFIVLVFFFVVLCKHSPLSTQNNLVCGAKLVLEGQGSAYTDFITISVFELDLVDW